MNEIFYAKRPSLEFGDYLRSIYPDYFSQREDIKEITFQVTENCCLNCSYCYQVHSTKNEMTFDKVKPWLEKLLSDQIPDISTKNTKAIIWSFIGGEPFLKIDLITEITDFIYNTMVQLNHPWLYYSRINFSSNGILYFEEKVQKYLTKYSNLIHLGISLDGNKELHDKCRVDLEGKGSYDRVIAAVHHYRDHFNQMPGIKMTFASENLPYLAESYKYIISEGYTDLWGNCVFENVWKPGDSTILYYQLKELADYIIDNNLYREIYVSFFEEESFCPLDVNDNENWCGGIQNTMFALDGNGLIYHCIRFMESSLQGQQEPIAIGDLENGIGVLPKHVENIAKIANVTRRSQSTDECFYCPVGKGCAWCSGYNYQVTGSVNKRVTYICETHKARTLANVYFWNKLYKKEKINKTFVNHLPKEDSLKIISIQELELLNDLERR